MDKFDRAQELLMKIRDERCAGNAAEMARRIKKDATYVNRLFYPIGKKGRKGVGLEIMQACSQAFSLPPGFWEGEDGTTSGWPFAVSRDRFDALTTEQRRAIESAVTGMIQGYEAVNKGAASGGSSTSHPELQLKNVG